MYACTRQFSEERRFTATSLNPLCRMRMFPLGSPNEALPPLTMLLASGGARARHRTSLHVDDKRLFEGSLKIRHAHFTRVCAGVEAASRSGML